MGRNRRGSRRASMKARLGIAAAVLLGGGAIGAVAVATSNHSPTAAQSAGYSLNFRHPVSVQTALSTALDDWTWSQQRSMSTLASMAPMKSFVTVRHGHTTLAAQRGVVVLATKHFLLVKSANGSLHLWLINGATKVRNVAASSTGMTALTGSSFASHTAMTTGNMTSASQVVAGTSTVSAVTNPAAKPTTVTVAVAGTGETITITITPSTATVMPATTTAAQQTGTSMTGTTTPTFLTSNHIARGDLALVTGVEKHGELWAQLVLFAPSTTTPTPTPSATATSTATVPAATPTATVPGATPSASTTQSGVHF